MGMWRDCIMIRRVHRISIYGWCRRRESFPLMSSNERWIDGRRRGRWEEKGYSFKREQNGETNSSVQRMKSCI
jgi:hypothetical protein